jgi:hypothetical protein
VHLELEGFLLAKKGISNIKPKKFICSTCYVYIENNKIPKFALANGLWIGIAPKMLIKLTMVEELQDFKGRKLSSRVWTSSFPTITHFLWFWWRSNHLSIHRRLEDFVSFMLFDS